MDTAEPQMADGETPQGWIPPEHLDLNLARSELRVPKASDVLADALRRQILSGELPEGYALPVERMLAAESGLSRTAVREALRILEIEGLVYTKAGRAGGSFIRRPDAQSVERTLTVFMAARHVKFRALLELREALGMNRPGNDSRARTLSVPRACGDEPVSIVWGAIGLGRSPRLRG